MDQYQYGITNQSAPVPESQVTRQITSIEKSLAELTECVLSLESRLAAVLRAENVGIMKDDIKSTEQIVPLALALARHCSQIEATIYKINSIKERIEL